MCAATSLKFLGSQGYFIVCFLDGLFGILSRASQEAVKCGLLISKETLTKLTRSHSGSLAVPISGKHL